MSNAPPEYPCKEVTRRVIGAAIEVHRTLGPGLLESAYEECLADEFTRRGMAFSRQVEIPVQYKGRRLNLCYRIDFLVENSVILELKSVDSILGVHQAQLLTYLKLTRKRVGLLINFNVPLLRDGLIRKIL